MKLIAQFLLSMVMMVTSGGLTQTHSADVSAVQSDSRSPDADPPSCNIKLSGPISVGDADKLKHAIDQLAPISDPTDPRNLCLDSPGGSMPEGQKLIELVFKSGSLRTVVQDGASCLSACAFLFLAGQECSKYTCSPGRNLHVGGRLGFHAPYLEVAPGNYSKDAVQAAYKTSTATIGRLIEALSVPIGIGDDKGKSWANLAIFVETLKKGPSELYFVDTTGKAGLFGIQLFGNSNEPFLDQADAL